MRFASLLIVSLLFLASCKKDTFLEVEDFGYNYQPNNLGYWVEYEVDSFFFNDITTPSTIDSSNFFIREVLDTTFLDASGEENIRVIQYKRSSETDPWVIYQVASLKFSVDNFQSYFNDLRFIKLIFPVRDTKEWQGNIYLDVTDEPSLEYLDRNLFDWNYNYSEVDEPKQVGAFNLDSCVVVTQIDAENLFEKKFSQEIYARNIGLVSKELIILDTQAPPTAVPFIERAESGFILKYTLKDYQN